MNDSILSNKSFRWLFGGFFVICTGLHAWLIFEQIGTWYIALTDAFMQVSLLALAILLISNNMRYYLPQQNTFAYIIWVALVISALIVYLCIKILSNIYTVDNYQKLLQHTQLFRLASAFLMVCSLSMFSMLWHVQQDQQKANDRKLAAEQLTKDAELFTLRQQLQPHFLFNSLNSIHALIGRDAVKARHMVHQLSDFLRFTIRKDNQQWNSLADEIHYVNLYFEIEKLRFGNRLSSSIIMPENANQYFLPALLLQPIVENAIKYGLYDTTDAVNIAIAADFESPYLQITVENPFDTATNLPKTGTGYGLSSIQRRLQLIFGRNDLLQTQYKEGIFTTTVIIPQKNLLHESYNN